ncbi:MAG TPA: AraC family transcriptional regulator [Candidatus Dormibacteraeota bacterium]
MVRETTQSSGVGLEQSCGSPAANWLRSQGPVDGLELLEAVFATVSYEKHRHDTYAFCLTTGGVQAFTYRGTEETSVPGQVVILHPDEAHDGRPGAAGGYSYRQIYVQPVAIFEAMLTLTGRGACLPFVRSPVVSDARIQMAILTAFANGLEPLAVDSSIVSLAEALLSIARWPGRPASRTLDLVSINLAREFLDAEKSRVVRSAELERVTGLSRYELARQFRLACGTSPYRYLLMRRLEFARERLAATGRLVDVALDAGFADQAHFTRTFKAAFGLTPASYQASIQAH